MSFFTAKECFLENLQLFGDPQNQPEKYNLYNGLANMVDGIKELQKEVETMKQQMHNLQATSR